MCVLNSAWRLMIAERIEHETLATGQAKFDLLGELVNDAGDTVARSHARYQMRPRRK